MSRDKQRLIEYLNHLIEATDRISRYVDDLEESAFLNNQLIQDAVIRNLEVVGEASRNICKHYPDFAAEHPEVPFSMAYEMRNALSHGYFQIDFEVVWNTVERDLPELEAMVRNLIRQMG